MGIRKWGRHGWIVLHTFALECDRKRTTCSRDDFIAFVSAFCKAIPCDDCKAHFATILQRALPALRADATVPLFDATVEWHNEVNARLGKRTYTRAEALPLYDASQREEDASTLALAVAAACAAVVVVRELSARGGR